MKQRPDGRWVRTVSHNGKRLFFYSTKSTEAAAARDINRQIMRFNADEAAAEKKRRTFIRIAEEWEDEHYNTIAWGTVRTYKPACADCKEFFGETDIAEVTPQMVSSFVQKLSKQGLAQKTVKHRLLVLNLIFKHAVISRYITSNPCTYISVPKNLRKEKRHMPSEEELAIVKTSIDKPFGFFAYFLLYTGLRRGEALALRYEDIDFDAQLIHVRRAAYWIGNTPFLKEPKTEAGRRDVYLLDNLLPHLDRRGKGYIFAEPDTGNIMRTSRIRDAWNEYTQATGLKITPHQLRHAYAGILYEAGISDKDAQDQLGHANISVTRDIYTELSRGHKEKIKTKLNKFVNESNN